MIENMTFLKMPESLKFKIQLKELLLITFQCESHT